jgi:O-antigen/teichoic acid export membrane protein
MFSIGSELGSLPATEVAEPLSRTLFSGFALLHRSSESPTRLYLGAVETAIVLILPAGLGISMVADPMVRFVMGAQWLHTVPVIQIIAIASTVSIFGSFSSMFLSAGGQMRHTFILSAVSVAVRIPLMIGLVYVWGLAGGAMAFAIAVMIDQCLFLWRTMHQLSIRFVDLLACTWRALTASLSMVGCLALLGLAWTPGNLASGSSVVEDLALRCSIGAAVYCGSLLFVWILAGRPDGVERQVLTAVQNRLRSLRAAL